MKNFIYFVCLYCLNFSFSQVNYSRYDYKTIKINFYKAKNDTERYNLANLYLQKAKQEKDISRIAKGYYLFSDLYKIKKPEKAIYYLNKVIFYSKATSENAVLCIAYTSKAYNLYLQNNIKEALNNYLSAEKIAKIIKNNDQLYIIKQHIAILKSEELGEVDEALNLYNECINYFKSNLKDNELIYIELLFDKADAFKSKKMTDSCTYYNKLGYKEADKYQKEKKVLFTLNEGANSILLKRYTIALDSINKSIPHLMQYKNYPNLLAAYYYKAKCFKELNNTKEAVKYFLKVDSLRIFNKEITPEFMEGYLYLIKYYKGNGDYKKELKYLTILNEIEKGFENRYRETYKNIKEKYEIPNLIEAKNIRIKSYKTLVYILIVVSVLSLLVVFSFYIVHKRNKEKFKKLLEESFQWQRYPILLESGEVINVTYKEEKSETKRINIIEENKPKDINTETKNQILLNLEEFEKNKGFLKKSITAQSLALEFNTNTKYISKTINDYKYLKVNEYINNLRIEYAVLVLKKNKKFRKYNLEALADEFGFNNVSSFNAAFLKKTGIKPSYFLKNINEMEL